MATKNRNKSQAYIQARHRRNVRKLVKAGLLKERDAKNAEKTRRAIIRNREFLNGKASALKASSRIQAIILRKKLGLSGTGKTIIVPRHKGERLRITKDNKIVGTRKQYEQRIVREVGKFKFDQKPKAGSKLYYTIPTRKRGTGKLKRHTFSSFDEMLFYLEKYEVNFEDIEDYIEVEQFKEGSRKQKRTQDAINKERAAGVKRLKKKRAKEKRRGR